MRKGNEIITERDEDGRWVADVTGFPGAIAYGSSPEDAEKRALELAHENWANQPETHDIED